MIADSVAVSSIYSIQSLCLQERTDNDEWVTHAMRSAKVSFGELFASHLLVKAKHHQHVGRSSAHLMAHCSLGQNDLITTLLLTLCDI